MHLKKVTRLSPLFLLLLLASCAKEEIIPVVIEPDPVTTASYTGVQEDLWVYFARFEEEGRIRGIEVDLRAAEITGTIRNMNEDGVAGQCSYNSHQPNRLTIDQEFWDKAPDLLREYVVFHELGHCDLGRDHREATRPDGTCQSLMRSGLENCRDNYRRETRDAYLDELFDPQFYNELGIF